MRRRFSAIEPGTSELIPQVARFALPFDSPADLDVLIERIGHARYVLLGEDVNCRFTWGSTVGCAPYRTRNR